MHEWLSDTVEGIPRKQDKVEALDLHEGRQSLSLPDNSEDDTSVDQNLSLSTEVYKHAK